MDTEGGGGGWRTCRQTDTINMSVSAIAGERRVAKKPPLYQTIDFATILCATKLSGETKDEVRAVCQRLTQSRQQQKNTEEEGGGAREGGGG